MNKTLPPLNWLRSFDAAGRHLNFTLAANELHLTPAAISQQIRGLESHLGAPLFERLPRGLKLTDAGNAYLPSVHQAIDKLAVTTNEVFGKSRIKQITICSNLVFFCHWLAPKLGEFNRRYPDIIIRCTSNIWGSDDDGNADVSIRYGDGQWPGLNNDRLTWDYLIPVCSPVLAVGPPPRSPLELDQHTLLHVIGYKDGWGHWLKETGYQQVNIQQGIEFDTLISASKMAVLGHGIALGRTSVVRHMLKEGCLIAPFPERVATDEAFYLTSPVTAISRPHVDTFKEWLLGEIEPGYHE